MPVSSVRITLRRVRTAVIGLGSMGSNHARIYSQLASSELVAVCDNSHPTASNVAKRYDVPGYVDYETMLRKEDIDALSIATPTLLHRRIAGDCIGLGKHILVEKPITGTLKEALELEALAKESGVKFMVGHIERFNPIVMEVKRWIEKTNVGDLISLSARRIGPYQPKTQDIGVVIDLSVHDIDVMRYLTGSEVRSVYAKIQSRVAACEDAAYLTMEFENGSIGNVQVDWLSLTKIRTLDVTGSKSYISMNYINQEAYVYKAMKNVGYSDFRELVSVHGTPLKEKLTVVKEEPLKLEIQHFLRSILDDKEPLVNASEGVQNLKVATAALRSGHTGQSVEIA